MTKRKGNTGKDTKPPKDDGGVKDKVGSPTSKAEEKINPTPTKGVVPSKILHDKTPEPYSDGFKSGWVAPEGKKSRLKPTKFGKDRRMSPSNLSNNLSGLNQPASSTVIDNTVDVSVDSYSNFSPRLRLEYIQLNLDGEIGSIYKSKFNQYATYIVESLNSKSLFSPLGNASYTLNVADFTLACQRGFSAYLLWMLISIVFLSLGEETPSYNVLSRWAQKLTPIGGGFRISRAVCNRVKSLSNSTLLPKPFAELAMQVYGVFTDSLTTSQSAVRLILPSIPLYPLTLKDSDKEEVFTLKGKVDYARLAGIINDYEASTTTATYINNIRPVQSLWDQCFPGSTAWNMYPKSEDQPVFQDIKPMSTMIRNLIYNRSRTINNEDGSITHTGVTGPDGSPWIAIDDKVTDTKLDWLLLSQYSLLTGLPVIGLVSDPITGDKELSEYYGDVTTTVVPTTQTHEMVTFGRRYLYNTTTREVLSIVKPTCNVRAYVLPQLEYMIDELVKELLQIDDVINMINPR